MADPRPRVGFLGVGRIGLDRLNAMAATNAIEIAAIADPSPDMLEQAAPSAPDATMCSTLDELLNLELDGIVIASPSALHAEQSIAALQRAAAVFCQKPLGRSTLETQAVVDAARAADRLLGVDLSYRHTAGMVRIRDLVRAQALGPVHAIDLTFHNAYGPDKPWFFDRALSGGGCVVDLGVHLVDLALWVMDFPQVTSVSSHLFSAGKPLVDASAVEDYAVATLVLDTGTVVRLACSWNLPLGRDAEIAAAFYGPKGGASLRNVGGSFFDFEAAHHRGTATQILSSPPEDWTGRAAADWARRLATDRRFDPAADRFVDVAQILDRIYAG